MLVLVTGTTRPTANTPAQNFRARIEAGSPHAAVASSLDALAEQGIKEGDIFAVRAKPAKGSSIRLSTPGARKAKKAKAAAPVGTAPSAKLTDGEPTAPQKPNGGKAK